MIINVLGKETSHCASKIWPQSEKRKIDSLDGEESAIRVDFDRSAICMLLSNCLSSCIHIAAPIMDCLIQSIPYRQTGYFSSLVLDYLAEAPSLQPFYIYSPIHPDFQRALAARRQHSVNRSLLADTLQQQYASFPISEAVQKNLELLKAENTFTVCTAHQPNIFTGYLYFIYKILQTIKLANELKAAHPSCHFVPVYYMGSEDNDLDELGRVSLNGKTLRWTTPQHGAVGRMRPEGFDTLIGQVEQELGYGEHALRLIALLKTAYLERATIQEATLFLVNALFGEYGLVVLIPDHPGFKRAFIPVIREELFRQTSYHLVRDTIEKLSLYYKVQANPRAINFFYLENGLRERIVQDGDHWKVLNTSIRFDAAALEKEITVHPERFSPNVILRGLLQETLLPNIAFIGGGGEVSYWLELKAVFGHYNVPYPVVLLRDSVMWINSRMQQKILKLGISIEQLFTETEQLIKDFVKQHATNDLELNGELKTFEQLFSILEQKASKVDTTLKASVQAERAKGHRSLQKVAQKMLRAEKKKMSVQAEQLRQIKSSLFPNGTLQERVENFMPYYALYGPAFFELLLQHLPAYGDQFLVMIEK